MAGPLWRLAIVVLIGPIFVTAAAAGDSQPIDAPDPAERADEPRDTTWTWWSGGERPPNLWTVRAEPTLWYSSPGGSVKLPGSTAGRETELSDLNADRPRLAPGLELQARASEWRFHGTGFRYEIAQDQRMDVGGQIGTLEFSPGDRLRTDLEFLTIDGAVGYRLLEAHRGRTPWGAHRVSIGIDALAGARYYGVDMEVSGPGGRAGADEWFLHPTLGGRLEIGLIEQISIELNMDFGAVEGVGDRTAYAWGIGLDFHYYPFQNLGVQFGYRHLGFRLEEGDGPEGFKWSGAHAGLLGGIVVRF